MKTTLYSRNFIFVDREGFNGMQYAVMFGHGKGKFSTHISIQEPKLNSF